MSISEFYRLKCVVVGNSSVGKSSLVKLLNSPVSDGIIESTIGAAFVSVNIELQEYNLSLNNQQNKTKNYQKIKLDVWDIAGSPRYNSLLSVYVRDVDICFLVFDLNDRSSWLDLNNWHSKISQYKKSDNYPIFVILANKSDLVWRINIDEIVIKSSEWNCKNHCVSAVQSNSHVVFRKIIYNTVLDFHKNLLSKKIETLDNQTLHANVYSQNILNLNSDNSSVAIPKFCCFQ